MNIVIIGGTRGIGKEVVLNLSRDVKNKILVAGRNESALRSLSVAGSNIYVTALDISAFEKRKDVFIKVVLETFKTVDILINVAGTIINREFEKTESEDARQLIETNFIGPAAVIRCLKPFMAHDSHIINISSMGGYPGSSKYPGLSYYSASKAALACLSECLAVEFSNSGIKVNCLALGAVQTEMLEEAFPGYKAPVSASSMAEYISWFSLNGHKYFNGKVLPVAVSNP